MTLSNEILEGIERMKEIYGQQGENQNYWNELNAFVGTFLEEKYTFNDMIEGMTLLLEQNKLPSNQLNAPNIRTLFKKYEKELQEHFAEKRP